MPPLIVLLRPYQWIKNGFVFAGPLFGHAWDDAQVMRGAFSAFLAFCLLSSAVYVGNDIHDRVEDRHHPQKRRRPLASGQVSLTAAGFVGVICLVFGLAIAWGAFSAWGLPGSRTPWIFLAYLGVNLAYTGWLKHIVILDVFAIASGFLLRLLAGTLGLGITPSHWLLMCGLMLTLFLGFAKRRAELAALGGEGVAHRRVLGAYSLELLDQFLTVTSSAAILAYCLYTVSTDTIARHGEGLILTAPLVVYGFLRYLWRLKQGGGGDPTLELSRDPHLGISLALWLVLLLIMLG
ncbi:MAG: decaprenyl-phosphate phosphoribosyltransferase [Rhodocyclaceae bacterium]|nr:decaprenyl-phosphate phosphoribosyltransferase [Rhodocyclaceae bacterium]